jgi:hypothetical protein
MAQFKEGDDIMNNEGVVYTITKVDSWKMPPTPPGEDPQPGDDEIIGYIYIAKNSDGIVKRIMISIEINPDNNVDVNGMLWRKTIQRGGKKSKKSMKKRKSRKSRKSKKSKK